EAAESEPELIQQPRCERVGVVNGQALGANQAGAGAEGESGVAIRKRRRETPLRALQAIPDERSVVGCEILVHLDVELVIVSRLRRIAEKVIDGLPGRRRTLSGNVGQRVQLVDD